MKTRSYVADERALTTMAASQGGYFTSKQAAAIGYTAPKRNYHVHVGNWVRERRGIFRLATQPLPVRPDLILWWLCRGIARISLRAFTVTKQLCLSMR
jgi:hypothetical protein